MKTFYLISWILLFALPLMCLDLHVGPGLPETSIQAAMLAVADGDTITVHDGSYSGRVIVNKEVYLRSLNGAEYTFVQPDTVWIPGIDIVADNAIVEGFSVSGATSSSGIAVNGASNLEIRYNRAGWDSSHRNRMGIQFQNSADFRTPTNNKLIGNTCSWNTEGGIYVFNEYHLVEGNTCEYNQNSVYDGIAGIRLYATRNCTIKDNICRYNHVGIKYAYNSWYDTVVNNLLAYNTEFGLHSWHQTYMMYAGNEAIDNEGPGFWISGIELAFFWGNRLSGNEVGIEIMDAEKINFHLNSFFDDEKFLMTDCADFSFKTAVNLCYAYGVNTYKSQMGNYYNDFTGPDADGDGLGDDTYYYQIGDYIDNKPLITSREHYNLQVWFLRDAMMFRNSEVQSGYRFELPGIGSSHVWIADGPTIDGMSYPAGIMADNTTWTGAITVPSPVNSYDYTLEIGFSDGTNFIPGGPEAVVTYTTWQFPVSFVSSESDFMIPGGHYLAMRITVDNTYSHVFRGGGAWGYVSAPIGSDEYVDYENDLDAPILQISYVHTEEFQYVIVEWDAVAGASSYDVYSCATPDGEFTLEPSGTSISETEWIDFIESDTHRFYKVVARD
jgi:parallel beta-helix repeat protein